ncbi:surface protease GP63 [Trypanosoma cruzi Dm28c]|uniref:Leishmanolysin-like peptidase n=1 Tax=Trypanosoma cruzi Dm28c TaxID=1416333 RepID=V5AUG3_TRYCR|nr:surface protease GP63 [Trypanosoma cruzi Dm28c]
MWCAPRARFILFTVRKMHLRAQDALQVRSGVWKDPWVPIRIKTSTTNPCDSRRHCGFFWRCAVNSLDGAFGCKNDALTFAHVNALAEETVPAAVKLHADRPFVQPLKGPLIVPPFATSSVCSWFTVRAGHCSAGVADSDMVLYVAAAPGGVWALRCATLEDGRPVVVVMNIAPAVLFHGRLATRIVAHLLAHALGFTYPHMAGRSVVRNVAGVRGRALLVVVHSATSAMAAREQHDCDNIDGMELQEDNGGGTTLESHWSRRHARDEWMSPIGGAGCCRGSAPHLT